MRVLKQFKLTSQKLGGGAKSILGGEMPPAPPPPLCSPIFKVLNYVHEYSILLMKTSRSKHSGLVNSCRLHSIKLYSHVYSTYMSPYSAELHVYSIHMFN